jgi:hypothetical protein
LVLLLLLLLLLPRVSGTDAGWQSISIADRHCKSYVLGTQAV